MVIGHNAAIAWGFTNLNPDVQDLYLEKVVDDKHVLYDGKRAAADDPRGDVRGRRARTTRSRITVRESRHGPIISDVSDDFSTVGADAPVPERKAPTAGNGYAVALRWTALDPGRTADAIFVFDRATNWDEFRDAARLFDVPAQNLVYADVDGHIGYQAPGRIPIRRTGNGDWPVPGLGPGVRVGRVADPVRRAAERARPRGRVRRHREPGDRRARTTRTTSGSAYDYGYRSQQIRTLLTSSRQPHRRRHGSDPARHLQRAGAPADAVPARRAAAGGYYRRARTRCRTGTSRCPRTRRRRPTSTSCGDKLLADTFHDQLPEDSWPDGDSRWWAVVESMLDDPDNSFWDDVDTDEVETRDDIVKQALLEARDELTRLLRATRTTGSGGSCTS